MFVLITPDCLLHDAGFTIGLLNKVVFSKVQEGLGGRLRQALSGGAPLSAECHNFIRICFGCPIMQGYALTETWYLVVFHHLSTG